MSTPERPVRFDSYVINSSSSPDLPSLSELFRKSPKKAPLRSGRNAAPIPPSARSTFATAADILREAPEIDIDTEEITYSPPRKAKPTKKPKSKARQPSNQPDAPRVDAPVQTHLSPKDKPWHKFKSSNSAVEDGQATLPKGRVTKVTATDTYKVKKKTEVVSKHFATTKEPDPTPIARKRSHTPPSLLPQEPAIARRFDWTPPPPNSVATHGLESDNRELLSSVERPIASKEVFQSLFDDYACKDDNTQNRTSNLAPELVNDVLKKRKRLELVSATDNKPDERRVSSPTKVPALKKKARTITDLATAPYVIPDIPDIDLLAPTSKESLLNYFDTDGNVKALVERQSAVIEKENSKAKKPAAKPKKKKKDGTVENPILLSPNSALKQSVGQDFVFGTSSQLVLEESPAVLRDLQKAMQASNQVDDPFASSPNSRPAVVKGLWHAAARDIDGDLLNVELVDLVNNQDITLKYQEPNKSKAASRSNISSHEADFVDIRDICSSSPQPVARSADPSSSLFQPQRAVPSCTTTVANAASNPSIERSAPSSTGPTSTPPPKYELFTDAQLAKQLTTYGFKPVKKREAMIALLGQCWTSKHPGSSISQSTLGATASISTSATLNAPKRASPKKDQPVTSTLSEPAKKPRGRPRKDSHSAAPTAAIASRGMEPTPKKVGVRSKKVSAKASSSTQDDSAAAAAVDAPKPVTPSKKKKPVRKVVEIADSDNDDSLLLSPQSSPEHVFSSPPTLDLSMSEEADMSLNLSPSDQETKLFSHITKAVTSGPRSKDPSNPSWHEKMLLYDPIVLEELAGWLNAGELTRVGYDGEVSPGDVKRWCESKSVICLWRVNLHGKERKRY